jgi:hypothetical protein
MFSRCYSSLSCGTDFEIHDCMIRFDHDPATSESPVDPSPTHQPVVEDLTPAELEAINRALDEALTDARRLHAGLAPPRG